MIEEVLQGGIANAGTVVRKGAVVLRPASTHVSSIHALLTHLCRAAPGIAPQPLGLEPDGRERLAFIDGEVPHPPYPAWSQADTALTASAMLLRRYHDAVCDFAPPDGATWSEDLADPCGGTLICHNDVCPENVVHREGVAVGLIDFDFAAPGRPVYDLAQLAKMWVPVDASADVARLRRPGLDVIARLRVVADAYGLPPGRDDFVDAIDDALVVGDRFVVRQVQRGVPAFVAMWKRLGGSERFERRRRWLDVHRRQVLDALE